MTSPPVQSITVVLADQRMEPFRPDVTVEWDAEENTFTINDWPTRFDEPEAAHRHFLQTIGSLYLDGFRKLVSLSTVVDDADYETPLEKDGER